MASSGVGYSVGTTDTALSYLGVELDWAAHKDILVWVSQDGRKTLIANMTESHLKNTIQWLDRRGASARLLVSQGCTYVLAPEVVGEGRMSKLSDRSMYQFMFMEAELARRNRLKGALGGYRSW